MFKPADIRGWTDREAFRITYVLYPARYRVREEDVKDPRRIICIHGYGVRGFFWTPIRLRLEQYFDQVIAPDLRMEDIPSAISEVEELARVHARESGHPVILFGHSLGGVLSAMAGMRLEDGDIDSLIIMASPYGQRRKGMNPLLKFLLRYRLIPGWMVRSQFFGKATPEHLKKALFDKAVPESLSVQEAVAEPKWFHTDALKLPVLHKVLGLASEADRIVSATETQRFTEALGGQFYRFPLDLDIGHDDFTVYEPAIRQVMRVVIPFLGLQLRKEDGPASIPGDGLVDGEDAESLMMR
jgi:pimeloyl-ACP methyl ester carboxylesterase